MGYSLKYRTRFAVVLYLPGAGSSPAGGATGFRFQFFWASGSGSLFLMGGCPGEAPGVRSLQRCFLGRAPARQADCPEF